MRDVAGRLRRALAGVDREIWLLLAFSVFSWMPLLAPGYFLGAHDAPHSLFFLRQFDHAVRDGVLIPRWGTDFALGYGYPLFLFYSPLAYYVAELFHLLGATITWAVKLTYLLTFILSALAMYFFVRRLFGRPAGLLAGSLYLYAPYHLLDVYVRSALSESAAFVFMPLVALSFSRLIEDGGKANLAWCCLSFAGLILTHNGTALAFTPLLAAYVLFLIWKKWRTDNSREAFASAGRGVAGALLGVCVSGFFLLPAFLERQFIVEEQWTQGSFDYLKHFVYPSQFLSPFWGYGYAGEGLADDMSFQLGLVVLGFSFAALCLRWKLPRRGADRAFMALAALLTIGMMLPVSSWIWERVPIVAFVQFPWRLLVLTSFTLSIVGGSLIAAGEREQVAPRNASLLPAGILSLLVVLASFPYTLPQYTAHDPRAEEPVAVIDFETVFPPDRVGMVVWTQVQPMTSPLVPQYLAGEPLTAARVLLDKAEVETLRVGGHSREVVVRTPEPTVLEFYTYYFPGWAATMNGKAVDIRPHGPYGLIALDVPTGEHRVDLRFRDTPVRIVGKLISGSGLFIAGVLLFSSKRARQKPI